MADTSETLQPVLTSHLFGKLDGKLVELLRSLEADDWARGTLAGKWTVKDVAAHLLDTQLRRLSIARDGYEVEAAEIRSYADLVTHINRLNDEGVAMYRRLSPDVLISLMEVACRQMSDYFALLDPYGAAKFAVTWAGEMASANWFDVAREYTERWHHQQQIRLAVGREGIMTRELYYPVLDCFMRALPFTYRPVPAKTGNRVQINISGECGGSWHLLRSERDWQLVGSPVGELIAETIIPQEIAWRIFTKGIGRHEAREHVQVSGNADIGLHVLKMLAIVG